MFYFLSFLSGCIFSLILRLLYIRFTKKQYGYIYTEKRFSTEKAPLLYEIKRDLGVAIEIYPIAIDGKPIKGESDRNFYPRILSKDEVVRQKDALLEHELKALEDL